METLKRSDQGLRDAVTIATATKGFDEVVRAVSDYRGAFEEAWQRMSEVHKKRSALPLRAVRLMRWAISRITTERALLAENRRGALTASRYLQTGRDRKTRTWGAAG